MSRLAQVWPHFPAKALILVNPTEVEIICPALFLVIPTELEIFYRDLEAKALLLVIPTEQDQIF